KERETGNSPAQAREEVPQFAVVAETVDGDGAALNLRHYPGNDGSQSEVEGLGDIPESGSKLRAWFWRWSRVKLLADHSQTEGNRREDGDKDEQAPSGAKTVLAHKNLSYGGRVCRWDLGGRRRQIIIQAVFSCARCLACSLNWYEAQVVFVPEIPALTLS